jgi:23S rRNA (uracil1939-C5)-methyltransferase
METLLDCKFAGKCGGCPQAERPLGELHAEKLAMVRGIFPTAALSHTPGGRVRDRADLTWQEGSLGLYALSADPGADKPGIVDVPECPMMSEALERWLIDYRAKAPPIAKGSVRLRVSPSGQRGVWLDFANADVKRLFDEAEYLRWLSDQAFVEVGQRRKALLWREGRPKLTSPELHPWFETYDAKFAPIPLFGPVGGFSQPGFEANRALVAAVAEVAEAGGSRRWLELFCGNGNFTLALAARGFEVEAVEMDGLALAGLERSLAGRDWPVRIRRSDLYLKAAPDLSGRGLIVDPPRAGLRELLERIREAPPDVLIYVSCFTEVFLKDCEALMKIGFKPVQVTGIDQFPYSPNTEWVGLLKLDR